MFFSKYRFPLILLGSLGISVSSYFLLKHFFNKEKKIEEKKEEEPYENKYYDRFELLRLYRIRGRLCEKFKE
jgi:C4-dicarboxylate transporter